MHNRIPLPSLENPQFKDVMDFWQQLQQAKTQKNQFSQNYELQKQAQVRANELLPHKVQQYKDQHGKDMAEAEIKQLYSGLIKEALEPGNAPGNPIQNNAQINENQGTNQPQFAGGIPQNSGSSPDQSFGEETELRPGNPQLSKLDKVAGLVPQVPKPERHYMPNGMAITRYPSGRVTIQKMEFPGMKTVAQETPEERQKREVETKSQQTQSTETIKQYKNIEKDAEKIREQISLLNKAKTILDKNKGLTGPGVGRLFKVGMWNSEPLGEFNSVSGLLAAPMTRMFSERGSQYAQKAAEQLKPNVNYREQSNYGAIKANLEHAMDTYNDLGKEYKKITGKDLPKLPDIKGNKYTDEQLEKFANEARAQGVPEERIKAKMAELKGRK